MEKNKNNSSTLKIILKVLKRRLKLRYLLFFALLISFNTFAWFIYMNKVSSDISVKVKAWNVSFSFDNETMTDYVNFNVTEIYPGMDDNNQSLKVVNDGEVDAKLSFELVYANVLGTVYDTESGDITPDSLLMKLENDYPFKINIYTSSDILKGNGGEETFNFSVVWPYETVDEVTGEVMDDDDTYWGTMAYDYKNNNPDKSCLELKVKISARQIK